MPGPWYGTCRSTSALPIGQPSGPGMLDRARRCTGSALPDTARTFCRRGPPECQDQSRRIFRRPIRSSDWRYIVFTDDEDDIFGFYAEQPVFYLTTTISHMTLVIPNLLQTQTGNAFRPFQENFTPGLINDNQGSTSKAFSYASSTPQVVLKEMTVATL